MRINFYVYVMKIMLRMHQGLKGELNGTLIRTINGMKDSLVHHRFLIGPFILLNSGGDL